MEVVRQEKGEKMNPEAQVLFSFLLFTCATLAGKRKGIAPI
jgi:hypothetical protein